MKFIKENIVIIVSFVALILMIGGVLIWNKIVDKQNEDKNKPAPVVDVGDVNNISSVESKLGYKMKITQGYLLTYTTNKSGVWYESSGYITSMKKDGRDGYITLSNKDKSKKIKATIDSTKLDVKNGDLVNFVGTIDLETGDLELSKISKEEIGYSNVTIIELGELVDNIKAVKDNIFVVSGYMITDGPRYKLFESKTAYEKDKSVGTYFSLEWDGEAQYTGNANVTVECKINGTYSLNMCTIIK